MVCEQRKRRSKMERREKIFRKEWKLKRLTYFVGPLFSEAEKNFNLGLTEKLEAVGFEVFLPQ